VTDFRDLWDDEDDLRVTMKLADLNGTFSASDLTRLSFPIAWPGAPDRQYEADLRSLIEDARAALASNVDAVAVEIVAGEIVGVEVSL
jgi:hypothetical protein